MNFLEELEWRGLIHDQSAGFSDCLNAGPVSAYNGFDPTAVSLHVGSLLPIMTLARLQKAGHKPVALVGGGTGMVGDPSGKSAERNLQTAEQVETNVRGIRAQLEAHLDFGPGKYSAELVNNGDWLSTLNYMEFLRDIGKHFTVNQMIAKESVRRRLDSEQGISYTEFSYMLLQAYDFLELYRRKGVTVQLGGSDQWGNITAGMDLIHRVERGQANGLTFPLVKSSSGVKFGKTEAGTIWLDPKLTSPYAFYQFWLNVDDAEVGTYLRYFTWCDKEEIEAIEASHAEAPHQRLAQRELAEAVTQLLHGAEELTRAQHATAVLFGGDPRTLDAEALHQILDSVPNKSLPIEALREMTIIDLLTESGLAASRGQAKTLVQGGGISLNGETVASLDSKATFLPGGFIFLRKGKKNPFLFFASQN